MKKILGMMILIIGTSLFANERGGGGRDEGLDRDLWKGIIEDSVEGNPEMFSREPKKNTVKTREELEKLSFEFMYKDKNNDRR